MTEFVQVRDEVALRRFVEHMAMVLNDMGFPRMPARVLITLMSADEDALTAAELGERLDVSAGAISGAVRYLIQVGMVVREPAPGSRRELYRLPENSWYEASTVKAQALRTLADVAQDGASALGGSATPSGRRLEEMRDFFLFCEAEMDALIERWRALRDAGQADASYTRPRPSA